MAQAVRRQRSLSDISILLSALYWVGLVRFGLTTVKLDRTRTLTLPRQLAIASHQVDQSKLAWAVRKTARFVPAATCLTQAQALQIMLARRGIASNLILGARHSETEGFLAHAWLERDDLVVIGGTQHKLESYSRLASYDATRK